MMMLNLMGMTVQGEVVSEMFDVDEVEEAFAKMRRAAGVRILQIFSAMMDLETGTFLDLS